MNPDKTAKDGHPSFEKTAPSAADANRTAFGDLIFQVATSAPLQGQAPQGDDAANDGD